MNPRGERGLRAQCEAGAALEHLGPLEDASVLVRVEVPIRTVSESNARGHWSRRAKRTRDARGLVKLVLGARVSSAPLRFPSPMLLAVVLTRIAPRALDGHDNLRAALKGCVDGVADWLGIDDRDPRVEWRYAQQRGAARQYAVRVEVLRREARP